MLDYKEIGSRILQLRKTKKMTQVELSELLSISHQAVSKWENGESLPDIEQLLRLANLFNLTMEEILLGQVDEERSEDLIEQSDNAVSDSTEVLWNEVLKGIKQQINKPSYDTWFKYAKGRLEDDTFIISSPNQFSTEWLLIKYSLLINQILTSITGNTNIKLEFQTDTSIPMFLPGNFNKYKTN